MPISSTSIQRGALMSLLDTEFSEAEDWRPMSTPRESEGSAPLDARDAKLPEHFNCHSEMQGSICILRFTGQLLSEPDVARFEKFLMKSLEGQPDGVVLDFSGLIFFISGGLSPIIRLRQKLVKQQAALRMCGLSKDIYEVFDITNVSRMVSIVPSEAEAVKSILEHARSSVERSAQGVLDTPSKE